MIGIGCQLRAGPAATVGNKGQVLMESPRNNRWTGPRVVAERTRRGWKQRRLVQELHRTAAELGETVPGVTVQMISRWENGVHDPDDRYQRLLDLTFARSVVGDDETREHETRRREFLRYTAAFAGIALTGMGDEPWRRLSAALQGRNRIDDTAVDNLELLTVGFGNLYQSVAPRALEGPVRSHMEHLTQLLTGSGQSELLRHRIASLAGETSILLGWIAQDQDDHGVAQRFYMTALDAADEAGDGPLGAYAIASASTLPAFRSSPAESIHLLSRAEVNGFRASQATPTTLAWVRCLEAEAHTRAGDTIGAFAALDAADLLLDSADDEEQKRPRVAFFNRARLLGERGVTAVRLNMPHEGRDALDEAVRGFPTDQKIASRLLTSLARAHLKQGHVDEACNLAVQSLAIAKRTDTSASVDDVRDLRHELQRWASESALAELDRMLVA